MKPICTFKVYPGRGTPKEYRHDPKRYFEVYVFPSRAEMLWGAKKLAGDANGADAIDDYAAMVMPLEVISFRTGEEERKPILGYGVFYSKKLGGGLVAHEGLHMALEFLRRTHGKFKLNPSECDDSEEELAYVLFQTVRQLLNGFIRHNAFRSSGK